MDFEQLSAKFINHHNNPLVKVDVPNSKLFLEDPSQHKYKIEKYQNIIRESLNYVRVDRRCARSKGIWMDDLNLCKITKLVGPLLKNFGFQDKRGIFLLLEEVLFLMEQNRLEMTFNNSQISICEAYGLLIDKSALKSYRVYKKLVGQGFKLLNKEAIRKFYSTFKTADNKKITRAEKRTRRQGDYENSTKLRKICDPNASFSQSENSLNAKTTIEVNFLNIFEKLRSKGPELILPEKSSKVPDYFGFLPSSTIKHRHDFNLYIREEINPQDFGTFEDIPNIVSVCCDDNIAFYRFPCVNIALCSDIK